MDGVTSVFAVSDVAIAALATSASLVMVALISGPLMFVLSRIKANAAEIQKGADKFDARNTEQHAVNLEVLTAIRNDVSQIKTEQTAHLAWHLAQQAATAAAAAATPPAPAPAPVPSFPSTVVVEHHPSNESRAAA
jgi:hypothetical protein